MEENNNIVPTKRKLSKQVIAIIVLAAILLIVLVVTYFVRRPDEVKERAYTDQEKVFLIEDVDRQNQEYGLPPKEKQIDIMKYNAQE